MKIVAIIQARMGSTRLPGKVALDILGKTVLEHVIDRVQQSKYIDEIIVATTELEADDKVVELAKQANVKFFRGSEQDVLSRYYYAAKKSSADAIVRITSDCPLIDPQVIDGLVKFFKENTYDLITNAGNDLLQRTYPRGLDTEIFSLAALDEAYNRASQIYQREHVTPYIYETKSIYVYKNKKNYSKHRWTLDTVKDFQLIENIYSQLYKGQHDFYLQDILMLMEKFPGWMKINESVEQKKLTE